MTIQLKAVELYISVLLTSELAAEGDEILKRLGFQ